MTQAQLSENTIRVNERMETTKTKLQVTAREDSARWIDKEAERSRYASRGHAFEYALTQLKDHKEKRVKIELL